MYVTSVQKVEHTAQMMDYSDLSVLRSIGDAGNIYTLKIYRSKTRSYICTLM